jgi:cell division protein FtsI/penicillin-binding protein 2
MSGKEVNDGRIVDNTLGVIQNAYTMGSSMKAATVLSGYMDDVISLENNTMIDTPLRIGNQTISSLFNRTGTVEVNDMTSLQYSSNVYMSKIAMRMGGHFNHQNGQGLPIDNRATINKMRQYYRQFGLGSATGIDLPGESTGQPGRINDEQTGQSLFLSFGQFDTYTAMQLAQYSATVANGGTRYAPRIVSEIRETNPETGEVGALVEEVQPKPLNHINVSDEEMSRVQEGLNSVINGNYGYAPGIFASAPYQAAGKTGTAQAFYWSDDPDMRQHNNTSVTNSSFIGYAPADDPQIAIAIVIPYLPNHNSGLDNLHIARAMFDAYFNVGEYGGEIENTDENAENEDVDSETETVEDEENEGE